MGKNIFGFETFNENMITTNKKGMVMMYGTKYNMHYLERRKSIRTKIHRNKCFLFSYNNVQQRKGCELQYLSCNLSVLFTCPFLPSSCCSPSCIYKVIEQVYKLVIPTSPALAPAWIGIHLHPTGH